MDSKRPEGTRWGVFTKSNKLDLSAENVRGSNVERWASLQQELVAAPLVDLKCFEVGKPDFVAPDGIFDGTMPEATQPHALQSIGSALGCGVCI